MPTSGFYDTISCGVDYGATLAEAALLADSCGALGAVSTASVGETLHGMEAVSATGVFGSSIAE